MLPRESLVPFGIPRSVALVLSHGGGPRVVRSHRTRSASRERRGSPRRSRCVVTAHCPSPLLTILPPPLVSASPDPAPGPAGQAGTDQGACSAIKHWRWERRRRSGKRRSLRVGPLVFAITALPESSSFAATPPDSRASPLAPTSPPGPAWPSPPACRGLRSTPGTARPGTPRRSPSPPSAG